MYHTEIDIYTVRLPPSPSPKLLGTAGSACAVTIPMRGANSQSGVEGVCSGIHHTSQQQEGLRVA